MALLLSGLSQSTPTIRTGPESGHLPQLDALRTFAVALVIVYHWFPTGKGINRLPNGTIGVIVFFVISGFLITRILINNRNRIAEGQATLGGTYRDFFVRRALRIFPLYYLVITFVLLFLPRVSDIDEHPLYYYFYGYNILLSRTGNWFDVLSPFWTLGVEEQLYFVWPWVVFLTPRPALRRVIGGMLLGGVLFRAWDYVRGDLNSVLTPASLDAFGLGALFAYLITERPDRLGLFSNRLAGAALLAGLGFAGLLLLPGNHWLVVLFQRLLIATVALYWVVGASQGFGGFVGTVLNFRALQYVGRISYGIYVFHMLVPGFGIPLLLRIVHHFGIPLELGYWSHRLLSLAALMVLASLSYYGLEKPINNLKRYFAYQ